MPAILVAVSMTVDLNDDHEVSGLLWFAALGCCAVND